MIVLFVSSCGGSSKKASRLAPYFAMSVKVADTLLVVDSINKHIDIEKSAAVFVLNSKCSYCLSQFVKFCQDMKGMNIPIIAIIHDHSNIMVEYMIDEFVDKDGMEIKLLENNDTYFKGIINRYSETVYVVNRGKIKNRFHYTSTEKP